MSSYLIPAGADPEVRLAALGTRLVVDAERTAGAFAVVEHDLAPHELGAPTHTHAREDEISQVTAGRLGVQIGEEVLEAGPGDTVVKPRVVPHAFWNPGDQVARFLEVITPAGFEGYVADIAPILGTGASPDLPALAAVMARYELSMDMGSVPRLIAAHGLNPPGGT